MQAMFEEWMTAATVDEYLDLKEPGWSDAKIGSYPAAARGLRVTS